MPVVVSDTIHKDFHFFSLFCYSTHEQWGATVGRQRGYYRPTMVLHWLIVLVPFVAEVLQMADGDATKRLSGLLQMLLGVDTNGIVFLGICYYKREFATY
jgi:hypothetical protein